MKISLLCSSDRHPIWPWLVKWRDGIIDFHQIEIVSSIDQLAGGDILFLISCNEFVGKRVRDLYKNTLLIHASDLPAGKGWSPHIWDILNGENKITVTLLEAAEEIDSGSIWKKETFKLEGHELFDEINVKLFESEIKLLNFAISNFSTVIPVNQDEKIPSTYHRKRVPEDSRLDPNKSIAEQFNLLRVVDAERYPAYFELKGYKYFISIHKVDPE